MILYTQICVWDHPWDPKNINIVRGDCYLKDPFQTKSTTFNLSRFRQVVLGCGHKHRFDRT